MICFCLHETIGIVNSKNFPGFWGCIFIDEYAILYFFNSVEQKERTLIFWKTDPLSHWLSAAAEAEKAGMH
jgi:hypothetical protein